MYSTVEEGWNHQNYVMEPVLWTKQFWDVEQIREHDQFWNKNYFRVLNFQRSLYSTEACTFWLRLSWSYFCRRFGWSKVHMLFRIIYIAFTRCCCDNANRCDAHFNFSVTSSSHEGMCCSVLSIIVNHLHFEFVVWTMQNINTENKAIV